MARGSLPAAADPHRPKGSRRSRNPAEDHRPQGRPAPPPPAPDRLQRNHSGTRAASLAGDDVRSRVDGLVLHQPIAEQGKYLRAVVGGHVRYFGVPYNGRRIGVFRFQVGRLWYRTLRRRSQTAKLNWGRMSKLMAHCLPNSRICHPYPSQRLNVTTQGKSRMR